MAHVRERIRMTEDEIWAYLHEASKIQIATLNRDGTPHLVTMGFATVDHTVVFHSFAKAQKIVNVDRDPRIAVHAEDGEGYRNLRGVSINGRAEIVADPDERLALALAVRRRSPVDVSDEALTERVRSLIEKRAVVRVHPERYVSWDHTKLEALGRDY